MGVAVKNAIERRFPTRRDNGLVEDLSDRQVGVQVDVVCQDEVLAVIFGTIAEGDQVGGRSDLVRVVRRPAAPAIFALSNSIQIEDEKVVIPK